MQVSPRSKPKDKGKSKQPTASKNVGKQPTNGSFTSPVKKVVASTSQPPIALATDFIIYLRVHVTTMMKGEDTIKVPMDKSILGYKHTLRLGANAELQEILNDNEWLSQTVISVYLRYCIQL